MTDFKYPKETDGIVSVDWCQEFPTTTQQDVPKIANTQFVDVKKEKMEVEVDSTANDITTQDDIGGNKYVEEEHSTDSRGSTGKIFISIKWNCAFFVSSLIIKNYLMV